MVCLLVRLEFKEAKRKAARGCGLQHPQLSLGAIPKQFYALKSTLRWSDILVGKDFPGVGFTEVHQCQ